MRPVRLDMTGFASFREPTVVDFTDADYFALVGPTGSGKSTVIDAMTFALYGSAPRWGKSNAIADALAPTANRCTVRLVFDLGPNRYVVAREVRRSGRSVQQKNVVLERLADSGGTGVEGEPSEVIAGDLKEVNRSIEQLLGLSFSDFCQCIVLPQGQFAEFLKATPKDRQEILLKLLGAGHYEAIAKAATARAALAGETATLLSAQLTDLGEATEAAETAARDREIELSSLALTVDKTLPVIADAVTRIATATAEHHRLTDEQARLGAEQLPAGLTDLQSGLDDTERTRQLALDREATSEQADTRARTALAEGPSRSRMEATLSHWHELTTLIDRRAGSAATAEAAAQDQRQAQTAATAAEQAVTGARDLRERTRQEQATAAAEHQAQLERAHRLASVITPDGVDALGARMVAVRQANEDAQRRREAAELADQQAREALRRAPARARLEQARADLAEAERAREQIRALTLAQTTLQDRWEPAEAGLGTARRRMQRAHEQFEAITADRTAAVLRPLLRAGHACPVCEQTVRTPPPPLVADDVETARTELTEAEAALRRAEVSRLETQTEIAAGEHELRSATARLDRLTAALGDRPKEVAAVTAELARIDALAVAMDAAAEELSDAREVERAVGRALDELRREGTTARAQLRATQGPLLAFGAPDLDDADLPTAWATLTDWTDAQIAELDVDLLPASRAALETAALAAAAADEVLAERVAELTGAQRAHTASVQAATQAGADHRALLARLAELETLLAGAPGADQARAQLDTCSRLEIDAGHAGQDLVEARSARADAERARARWDHRAAQARIQLQAARDRLVPLGAPQLDAANLAAAWAKLLSWAAEQGADRRAQIPAALDRITRGTADHDIEVRALRALAADHGIDLDPDEPLSVLPTRMATALERARTETRLLGEKRSRAATLTEDLARTREQQQVAKLLADLLRFDKFPRWLAAAALDTLVADASVALSNLSGGQFDLAHDRGEFVVIDHADADSRRSVRTLSGGETFQASLALALALSAQLSTLAAEGAARLDSIFLDEGFGTLDPETLEVVAGTLENLAHGERMVGVVTHVAALAERAPVRFAVQRDQRTSSIVRLGAG